MLLQLVRLFDPRLPKARNSTGGGVLVLPKLHTDVVRTVHLFDDVQQGTRENTAAGLKMGIRNFVGICCRIC